LINFRADGGNAYLDSTAVLLASDRTLKRLLGLFGARVRLRARQSIRREDTVADPGDPPHSHGDDLLKEGIRYDVDMIGRRVIIGPIRLPGKIGDAPLSLEAGGESEAYQWFWQGSGAGRQRQKKLVRTVVRAHAFMVPALNRELEGLDKLWARSIR